MASFIVEKTLGDLAAMVPGVTLQGDPAYLITGVSTLAGANAREISFLTNAAYRAQLRDTKAGAVILSPEDSAECTTNALITNNPHAVYAQIATLCVPTHSHTETVIAKSAVIASSAVIGKGVWIGEGVVIGERAVMGDATRIDAHCVIGEDVVIGKACHLYPAVVLYHGVKLGSRVTIHAQTVVGSDGFGFAMAQGQWIKVPQLGSVDIGDDVEIGSQTTIDRGAIEDTRIETGVKIDNRVQIAHNVVIGAHSVIAGCAAFAGSSRLGKYCVVGGGATFAGHITVCDKVQIAGMTTVTRSIDEPGVYASGTGMMPAGKWRRAVVHFRHLNEYVERIKALEKAVASLDKGSL
ncbi:MAG: UDP-3-O-(3-hydroxymyristoyl)glucosamine N-acyltransferase [Gammaproteobacteria bacterium]